MSGERAVRGLGEIALRVNDPDAMHTHAVVAPNVRAATAKNGPGRDRTCDLGIKSPLLYQLSYRPVGPV